MLTAAGSTPHIHIPFQRIEEHICLIADRKLNLEIYFSAEVLDAADERRLELIHELLSYGPDISFHAPFMDLCPAALDARIREVTRARFEQTFTAASIFKPKCIVFHSGYEKWKYSLKFEPWLENSMSFWAPLIERASILNTKIAIENIFENEPSNLLMLMQRTGSPHFGVCFDTGHFNLFSDVSLSAWMDTLKDYLIELHLHDNDKSADQHLPVGDGIFDFGSLFQIVKGRDLIYTIETHTPERVLRSMNRLGEFMPAV